MLIYNFLKFILRIALRVFFRRFQVHNRERLRQAKGPLIVAVNHPNTFMDPLIVAAIMPRRLAFIANGSIFNRFTRPVFSYLHVIPVYRKKDTADVKMSPAALNKMTFQRCYDYLAARGSLLIFPEGTSEIERRLRELKTGTARIALGAEYENDFNLDLTILPIGLNYSDPTLFRSEVFVNVGEPIAIRDFKKKYRPDSFDTVEELTDLLQQRLAETVIITEDDDEDTLVRQVETLYKNQLFDDLQLDERAQKDEFELVKQLVAAVRFFEEHHPEQLRSLKVSMTNYLENLQKLHLSDQTFTRSRRLYTHIGTTLASLIVGLPVYVFGLVNNYLPYILPSKIARWISSDITYRAPIMMTAGIVLFPLFYGVQIWAVHRFFQQTWLTIAYALSLPISGFFVLWYLDLVTRLTHAWQALRLFRQKPSLMQRLSTERAHIFKSLEKAKEVYMG